MENKTLCAVLIVAGALIILVALFRCKLSCGTNQEMFTKVDHSFGSRALKLLEKSLEKGDIPEVSDEELQSIVDRILLIKEPADQTGVEKYEDKSSNPLSYFQQPNTRLWPYYYYSFPYNEKYGGAWPPGMYSRLYYWSPGFYSGSGWQISMRPGIGYNFWPRDRWIRNTKNGKDRYYYVTNLDDYIHKGTADYDQLPLYFP